MWSRTETCNVEQDRDMHCIRSRHPFLARL